MQTRFLAALLATTVLGACGFDATPQSSGSAGSSSTAAATPEPEKTSEGEKKTD